MTDRIDQLASSLTELQRSQGELEKRIAALESDLGSVTAVQSGVGELHLQEVAPVPAARADGPTLTGLFSTVGRTLLVLAGAFLLRALTDGGILPQWLGAALGLVYAMTMFVFADRDGGKGKRLSASFHGISALLIAYPLLWETITRLSLLSPVAGGACLTVVTGYGLLVAYRRKLRILAWASMLASLLTILALYQSTKAMELHAAILLLLAFASIWIGYGRRWLGIRWVVAVAANLVILQLTLLVAHPEGPRAPYQHLSVPVVQALAVSLLLIYLGSFSFRTLARRRGVTTFEVLQTGAALLVGFWGAVRIAQASETGAAVLGIAALAAAAACYALAFTFVHQHLGRGRNFFYYAWLALVFTFLGSHLIVGGDNLILSWMVLALASALLGGHYDRVTLRIHSAVYLTAATLYTGLFGVVQDVFTAPAGSSWRGLSSLDLSIVALALVCYAVLVLAQRGRDVPALKRIPRFVVALWTVLGLGSLAVIILIRLFGGELNSGDAAMVAAIRTGVLTVSAICLAAAGRHKTLSELAWLATPVLVGCGIKLLVEDLRSGNPVTLFLGFLFYGIALIATPRLLRAVSKREPSTEGEPAAS